jgi:DNA invertase Pin-like site-specific DNA recombinase
VSRDRSGRERSISEQSEDNQRAAGQRHVVLAEPYADRSISASRFTSRARGGFDRLVADLRGGRFGADELVLWESSRGSRRVDEWLALIDACGGVRIYVTTHGRSYDPANPRDRRSLLEDAVDSDYESGKASVRILRAVAANASTGRPHGRILYGYRREYEPMPTGKPRLLRQVADEATAPIVREAARRVLSGETPYAVAESLNRRGVPTPRGGTHGWDLSQVRRMLINPGYAGQRVHRGKILDGVKAQGDELITPADHLALVAKLADPARRTQRDSAVRHLLSGIARCGLCGAAMRALPNRGDLSYTCPACFRVSRRVRQVDAMVVVAVVDRLADPDLAQLLTAARGSGVAVALAKVRELRNRLDAFYDKASDGSLSPEALSRIEARLLPQIAVAERAAAVRPVPTCVSEAAGPDAERRWDAMSLTQRREIIRALVEIRILPTGRGRRIFDPTSVEVRWVGAGD